MFVVSLVHGSRFTGLANSDNFLYCPCPSHSSRLSSPVPRLVEFEKSQSVVRGLPWNGAEFANSWQNSNKKEPM